MLRQELEQQLQEQVLLLQLWELQQVYLVQQR